MDGSHGYLYQKTSEDIEKMRVAAGKPSGSRSAGNDRTVYPNRASPPANWTVSVTITSLTSNTSHLLPQSYHILSEIRLYFLQLMKWCATAFRMTLNI